MSLQQHYQNTMRPELVKEFHHTNVLAAPRLEKVVVNVGTGRFSENKKALEDIAQSLALITGQKPAITRAKKSIASFKVREGMDVGMRVTLRGARAFDFLERLINIALPRTRDFSGLKKDAFDAKGNYTVGIREAVIFPEINPQEIQTNFGMEITVVVSSKSKAEAQAFIAKLGMPLQK